MMTDQVTHGLNPSILHGLPPGVYLEPLDKNGAPLDAETVWKDQDLIPIRANPTDSCYDCRARNSGMLTPGQTGAIPLGFRIQLPEGWEGRIRGRSGMATRGLKSEAGTIDYLYRKEVHAIVTNCSNAAWHWDRGDRICQMTFAPVFFLPLILGPLPDPDTGRGGLGSTGMK